jgi:hypothetical protein
MVFMGFRRFDFTWRRLVKASDGDLTLSLTASNLTNKAPIRYVGEPDNGYDTNISGQSTS